MLATNCLGYTRQRTALAVWFPGVFRSLGVTTFLRSIIRYYAIYRAARCFRLFKSYKYEIVETV